MPMIDISTPDGRVEAYRTGDETTPGVLFFIDAIGLRPQIHSMCDRIAGWGYSVLAPNVLFRSGRVDQVRPDGPLDTDEKRAAFFKHAMPRVRALTPERAERDIPAYVAALREHAAPGPIGTTGYCMGARLAVRAAGLDPAVAACGGFHGGGLATEDPDSPHTRVATSGATFVFGHADGDRSMPPEQVERLEQALVAAGRPHTNEVYAGATHGYTMADTTSYDEAAAERHYVELEALLARTLR
jgi:carboxymethylenebutenolidase